MYLPLTVFARDISKLLHRESLCFVSRIRRKAGGPVSQPFYTNKLWDVKERTHCSQRVGHVVPGVVVYLDLCHRRSGWVRCDHNGLKRLPEAPLICWRPFSPLWFLRNSALGCKWGNWHHSSIYLYHLSFPVKILEDLVWIFKDLYMNFEDPLKIFENSLRIFQILVKIFEDLSFSCQDLQGSFWKFWRSLKILERK